jgi:nitrate reductase NapE component
VSMTFLPCPNPAACLAGTPMIPAGSCAPGYTGIMCGNCISGYRRSGPFRCSECPTLSQNWVYLLILLAITLLIVFIIVRAHLYFNDKHTSIYEVLLKLIVSHFHILGIIMSIEYSWPLELKRLQNGYAYFSGISQEIFSFDCFLQQIFGSASLDTLDDSSRIYSFKLIIFALAPIIVLALCGVFWFLLSLVRRDFSDFKIKTISATLVIFFIIHPSIARIYF